MNLKLKRQRKKYPCKCAAKGCRGVATKSGRSPYCSRHRMSRWADAHPLSRAFHNLRTHARERGILFTLTIEQFKAFAEKTDYMKYKGKSSMSLQIDRKDNSRGYHADNIRACSLRENTRKNFVPYFQSYKESTMEQTKREIAEAINGGGIGEFIR